MARALRRIIRKTTKVAAVMLVSCVVASAAPLLASPPSDPVAAKEKVKLEAFVETYSGVYFALGACDGFLSPQQEAPFDPFGPMLEKWPDSFKRQMIAIREEGRVESLRLAKVHKFTFAERAELCSRQMDSSQADLDRLRARYLK